MPGLDSLREFPGYGLSQVPPEHSTLSKTRKRLSLEVQESVFGWVLERLQESGLLRGKTLGVDSTTLEANASMRAIVRRDDGAERMAGSAGAGLGDRDSDASRPCEAGP